MISFKTLLFPDTAICKDRLYPLFLFFAPIHFLQTVEPDAGTNQSTDSDIFMEHGLCQGHTPVPLEKNRQRFLHLIKDIRERKDDYGAQLASLTMAAMSAPASTKRGEAKHEIISSLLNDHSLISSSSTSDSDIDLWQARLVLEIAEMLEKDEEELRQELDILDSREMEMFRTLQGESADEDDPFAELEQIQAKMETRRPLAEKNRFKAWLQLMKHFQPPDELFWLASSADSADQVSGRFEEKTGGTAVPILRLPLPKRIHVSTGYLLKEISTFHEASQQIRREIRNELESLARLTTYDSSSAELLLPGNSNWSAAWESLLEEHFPMSSHHRSEVIIYILPDTRVEDVL
ncbi:MAG: hypothetical protein V2I35_14440, partial [Desulfocapsaceae bacterium]|nr:hypothetical protein [Desulfocapsaceae bacterium]